MTKIFIYLALFVVGFLLVSFIKCEDVTKHYPCFKESNVCTQCGAEAKYTFFPKIIDHRNLFYEIKYPDRMLRRCLKCSYDWYEEVGCP